MSNREQLSNCLPRLLDYARRVHGMLKGIGGYAAVEEPDVLEPILEHSERTEFCGTERYELGELLGVGAMGVVYQAFDRELNTLVALKCLPGASAQAALRFKREFRSLRDVHHENLVALGELVSADDQLFFTMELVDGTDIVSYCQQLNFDSRRRPQCRAGAEDPTLDEQSTSSSGSHERRGSSAMPDEARLRLAFAGLTRGLMALHAAHKVHRDIKPSNVLVTAQGRVVVLDFGVVLESTPEPSEEETRLIGTIAYMSPEQAARQTAGFESDWYSVGVVLFEALTQRLPFEGTSSEVLQRKQAARPPRVSDFEPTVSPELDELCDQLLQTKPNDRPLGPQILSVLEGPAPAFTVTAPGSQRGLFVGRAQELARLNQALASARAGHAALVHVEGQSGSGKTALLRDFSLRASRMPGTLVLQARCSEREYVPFRAIDGAVDALAEYAVRSNATQLRSVLDSQLPHLARAFPVFGRIGTNPPADEVADPYLSRLNLFRALCALLTALREETMVVLILDDMQWADADSLALLSAVLRPPHAPAVLVVAASRPQWPGRSLLRTLGGETVAIDNLPTSDAITLARQLVARTRPGQPQVEQLAERIAYEAAGHPLFIDELVRQNVEAIGQSAADVTLDSVLWARVEALAPQARTLVHLVAVARGSLPLRVLTRAARQTLAEVSTLATLILLRNEHLLELDGTSATSHARAYHDRINAATLLHLPKERRAELHAALAQALEVEPERDPEQLAVHWREAGDSEAAAGYALAAAGRAAAGLAFEQAASLYQMALDSWPSHPDAQQIQVLMADALASAGLGPRAAQAYLKASEVSDEAWRIELQRYAADQLFRAGHIDAAEPLIQRVLRYMGISIPESIPWVIIALLLSRAQLAFSRIATVEPSDDPVDASKLAALDACWSAAVGLSMVSNLRGACMQSRHMILALKLRQRLPLIRALATHREV
jgi:eukaryotic-like serine/threonine-protein kinase